MDWLNTDFLGLNPLHWLISILIPLVLFCALIVYWIINRLMMRKVQRLVSPLIEQINALPSRTIANLPAVSEIFNDSPANAFRSAFKKMEADCQNLYQNQWLPDPEKELGSDVLFRTSQANSLTLRPAAAMLAVGLLGTLASLLVQNRLPVASELLRLSLILLPLVMGMFCALLMAPAAHQANRHIQLWLQKLYRSLEGRLPVFNEQAGLALLIDKFTDYDRQMNTSLKDFNATASRLAEGDMVEGVRRGVEQVMMTSVAPSIEKATSSLASLGSELTSRQENGMQDLAIHFATALSADLADHLQPINKEIDMMGALMTDVKNYIEYAMRAMETTRVESEKLLGEAKDSLKQMAIARNQLTEDFAHVDSQVTALTEATGQMADIYKNNEHNAIRNVEQLGVKLDEYGKNLSEIVTEAINSMQNAKQSAADQQGSAGLYLSAMQDQVSNLSKQLGTDIQNMLVQVRKETTAIADHSATIGQQLGSLNDTLDLSLNNFTSASAKYVNQTLTSFDTSLAELTERLARTAAEIRDAVDALPMALRQDQGQATRFDG